MDMSGFAEILNSVYNAVQYDIILYTSLRWLRQSINHSFKSQFLPSKYIPYLALLGELWDVFFEDLVKNWPRYNVTVLYRPWITWITFDVFFIIP